MQDFQLKINRKGDGKGRGSSVLRAGGGISSPTRHDILTTMKLRYRPKQTFMEITSLIMLRTPRFLCLHLGQ